MKKVKIIEFFGEPLNYGGQEAFILNMYSKINKERFEFTFVTPFECTNESLKKEIEKNGDKLIYDNQLFESKLRKKYIIKTAKTHIKPDFDVIHIHSGSVFTLYNIARIAKKFNKIKKVIIHSHATGKNSIKYRIMKKISDTKIKKYVDYYFACSKLAAEWKFPKSIIKSNRFKIIKNGIDLEKFKYNEENRKKYRTKFGLNEEPILIHVGRFSKEKNQLYILDIFSKIIIQLPTAKLFLVGGTGELYDVVKIKVNELGLSDNVIILLNRPDVNELINMSDVFILPSLWEGLPFTGIEAQANGIPCVFSDTITEELNISKSYNKLSIEENPSTWAKKIIGLFKQNRIDNTEDIRKHGFDIFNACKYLEKIYGEE